MDMEKVLTELVVNAPVAAALLIMAWMFLRYLREERQEWRQTIQTSLENNTSAMNSQAETLRTMGEAFRSHDEMARSAVRKINEALEQQRQ